MVIPSLLIRNQYNLVMNFKIAIVLPIISLLGIAPVKCSMIAPSKEQFLAEIFAERVLYSISNEDTSQHRSRRALHNIGRCSFEEYLRPFSGCGYIIYKRYRAGETFSCTTQFSTKFLDCVGSVFRGCLRFTVSNFRMERAISAGKAAINTPTHKSLYCTDGTIERSSPSTRGLYCNSLQLSKYTNCVRKFHNMYDRNRGDPALCQSYNELVRCDIGNLLTYCPKSTVINQAVDMLKMLKTKDANPFCSFAQGGADVDGILAGNWRPGVYPTMDTNTAYPFTTPRGIVSTQTINTAANEPTTSISDRSTVGSSSSINSHQISILLGMLCVTLLKVLD